ncbi:TPA: hypothetical protein RQO19_004839 [Klebsiella michiganensis]|nr:hypothetical protein [Klebsiella michiganensis]
MFSEVERLRAIGLYYKYGRKVAQVVRELGWPSEKQLRRWVNAWETSDCSVRSVRRKPRYNDAQKQAAVDHYFSHGCCLAFTRRTLGYPCSAVLIHWINEMYPGRRVSVQREPSGHNLMYPTKWCTPNSGGNQSVRYAEKCDFRQA